MRVSIIEPVGAHGGMNYYDSGLVSGLESSGVSVKLYTSDINSSAWGGQSGIVFSFIGVFGKGNVLRRALSYVKGVVYSLYLARRDASSIVHIHLFHYGVKELLLTFFSFIFRFKIVATVHDVESFVSGDSGIVKRMILASVDRFVVHNEYSRSCLIDTANLSPSVVDIVPHGNYLKCVQKIGRVEARLTLGFSESEKIILFFGQIKKVKALDLLIRSLPSVSGEVKNVTLLVAGKYWKNSGGEYTKLIDELGLRDKVRLDIGYVPDDKVHLYYCACDVVVLPYREIFQSGVLLMALSYERPVVVSDIPGMTEIVSHEYNGLTFKPEDSNDLACQIVRILRDDSFADRLAKNGFAGIVEKHSWARVGSLTKLTYNKALG